MKFCEFLFVLFVFLVFSTVVDGQQLKENEIVVIHGEKYVLHQVRTGETIYSISRQFGVDSLALVTHNPQLSSGTLKIGDILKIPYRKEIGIPQQPVSKKGDPSRFGSHTITSRRETPYFIAKEYGITVEEIYAYNPEVTRFRKGITLRIPIWDDTEELAVEGIKPSKKAKLPEETEPPKKVRSSEDTKTDEEVSVEPVEPEESSFIEQPPAALGTYFEHTIVSGETLWRITRKYGVSEKELKDINPVLETGFPAGVTIKVPVKETELSSKAEPINDEAFEKHVVESGETLYGLANQYNITIPLIKKFNPVLEKRNLVSGETILIPRTPVEPVAHFREEKVTDSVQVDTSLFDSDYYKIKLSEKIPDACRRLDHLVPSKKVYDIALFLPLFIFNNDTLNAEPETPEIVEDMLSEELEIDERDTIIEEERPQKMFYGFYKDSENFLQFYEGVLLAVDSMQRAGMNIRLNVFDTQLNADSIRKYIYGNNFLETDLIIGPVYPHVQQEVAAIASKNRIPMVSPLSSNSEELKSNPYYYQVNPSRDFITLKTAELVAEEYFNSNFIFFKTGDDAEAFREKVPEMVRERLFHSGYWGHPDGFNFRIYDFDSEGPFGFSRILSPDKENVVFIPTLDEGDLSVALSNIDNFSHEYSITLIGFNWYQQFKSINVECFHNLKLHYIAPYWIDYENPATIRFFKKFREYFNTEPDNFGIQGYDVAFYFLNALKNFGKDFHECLPYMQIDLVQGIYQFEKVSRFGGYMNHGVSVICHEPDYDVVRKRVVGQYTSQSLPDLK